ncbi:MAG: cell wall anchor domain-containing protein [Berkelbacteria bacterium GW2011_GWB1_38_5]|uniref:Cell wall anchor domain-containing protein n=2 Tax=Candidatus Berkelbacteria TaxID=1618330 RepID=A0A0G0LSD2_9BACT|nr:MAG: cell wall anchor domain-containing protein [Berkelbacteria bacterium GW2011_GWB1_38_5]KKQ90885.1 MAG: cell wall anchor domain-containing protein [Berkelbacteria bacterium GW2011_GWA1_39_10]
MNNEKSWGLGNFIAIVVLAAILILGGSILGNWNSKKQADKQVAGIENQIKPVVKKVISYDGQNDKTVLDLLKQTHEVKSESSSVGVFVTSIDGSENQSDSFWMFYVDNQLAPVGPDQYKTKDGEKIEWRYEQFQ